MRQAALFSIPVTPVSGLLVVILLAIAFILVRGPQICENWRDVLSKEKPPNAQNRPEVPERYAPRVEESCRPDKSASPQKTQPELDSGLEESETRWSEDSSLTES